jgi:hypothetical protein
MNLKKDVGLVVSFEPDKKNIDKLIDEIKAQNEISDNTEFFVYPMGVYPVIAKIKQEINSKKA